MVFIRTRPRDPGALGGPVAGLSFVAGVATAMATAKSPFPRPGATPQDVREYFNGSATSARVSVAGQLLSAAALVPFTASVAKLAGRTGRSSSALQAAAVAGGGFAATTLATSALTSATLTREQPDLARVRTLQNLMFLSGGPVHNVGLGLLTGSLGLAGLRTGELPRALSLACLAVATLGILSPLSLAAPPTMVVIPLARFPALILGGIAGARLFRRSR
jgi:hypothetical protein